MSEYIIKMPDIGEGIAEVEIVAWRVQPGQRVQEDDIVADVMTDKATVEIPAPVAGTVLRLGGAPGALLAVGSELLCLQVTEDGGNAEAVPAPATPASATPAAAPLQASQTALQTPQVPQVLPRLGAIQPLASPAVRQRARQLGIALQFVPASAAHGRITHQDLDAYLATLATSQRPPAASADTEAARRSADVETIPITGLRRSIARKMQEAKRRIPHFSYVEEVDVSALLQLRARLNARHAPARGKLTLLPFLVRALVLALRNFPQINARFDDEAQTIARHKAVHVGIATQTASGLMVPVLRHAENLDVWQCAREVERLAQNARDDTARREELTGSTITLSSLGALGGIASTPVINWPEVAIVAVNRIVPRPVLPEDGNGRDIAVRQMMNLSSSFDHRVIDGMDAARFIQRLRELLQSPALLFVE